MPHKRFSQIPESIWLDTRITDPQPLVIYSAIQFHTKGTLGEAWPSMDRIATLSRLGRSTVYRHIETLISLGYVEKVARPGRSSLFRLLEGVSERDTQVSQNGTGARTRKQQQVRTTPLSLLLYRKARLLGFRLKHPSRH
jgi:DNA-binding transcriptional MocR family regulator